MMERPVRRWVRTSPRESELWVGKFRRELVGRVVRRGNRWTGEVLDRRGNVEDRVFARSEWVARREIEKLLGL